MIAPKYVQTLPPLSPPQFSAQAGERPEHVLKRSLCARYTNQRLLLTTETLAADLIEQLLIVWVTLSKPSRCSPQPLYNQQCKQLKNKAGQSLI